MNRAPTGIAARSALAAGLLLSFIAALLPIALAARPRPVSPYYALASDSIQGELSAALAGLRSPAEALSRAQRIVRHLEER